MNELIPFETSRLFDKNYVLPEGIDLTVNRGGTSSGKTYALMQVLCLKAYEEPGVIITVIGQDIPNLKKGAIRDLHTIVATSEFLQSIIRYYNKTDRILHFKNGSIIEFNSYDNEQDAKNGKREYSFFNEVNGIEYGIFEAIYVRTKIHTWVDFNPSGEFWLSDKKIEDRENVRTFRSTYEHNPFLDESIIKKIKSYEPTPENEAQGTADEYRWRVYGKGEYAPLEGAVIKRWKNGKFDDTLSYVYAIDWGYTDPFTLTKIAVDHDKRKIYVKELAYESGLSMAQIEKIVSVNCTKDDVIVCDKAEPMSIKYLRDKDYNAIACWKPPGSIVTGLRWLQEYLIVVDNEEYQNNEGQTVKAPTNIQNELKNYIWAEKRSETPVDKHNHSIDGIRYGYAWIRFNILQL